MRINEIPQEMGKRELSERTQATALGLGGGLGVDNGISVNLSGSNVCSQESSTGAKKAYEKLRKR